MDLLTEIKFFPRDVIAGKAEAVNDEFTAQFFGSERTFKVTSHHGEFFFADLVD